MNQHDKDKKTPLTDAEIDAAIGINVDEYMKLWQVDYSREGAYDIVHKLFREYIGKLPGDEVKLNETLDMLARNLYMFLANWGMLRNSFLMDLNYTCLTDICKTICGDKYSWLLNVSYLNIGSDKDEKTRYINAVLELNKQIKKSLHNCLNKQKESFSKLKISDRRATSNRRVTHTLVSKILLVTLGCVPAYDKQAREAMVAMKIVANSISENGLDSLIEFVSKHKSELENVMRYNLGKTGVEYTAMKYLDMFLWIYGKPKVEE